MANNPTPAPGPRRNVDDTGAGVNYGHDAMYTRTVIDDGTTANSAGYTSGTYNYGGRGLEVYINVTANAGTSPTLTVTIEGVDPVSGSTYTLLASSAIAAAGFTRLLVYPGCDPVANAVADSPLPQNWAVKTAIGGSASPSVTAQITACPVP